MTEVTRILEMVEGGDPRAAQRLLPLVYDELRRLAAAKIANEPAGQTLQATALVHEAWLRLVDGDALQQWNGRRHFFGAAAEAMRRILVDLARRKAAGKHGGGCTRVEFDERALAAPERPAEVLKVNEALDAFAAEDALAADLVKLHYFAGLPMEEAAEALGLSRATAYRTWTYARAWLRSALQEQDSAT
jgi:RNA polymerase sigma factor (TIGR02999 family)